MVVAKEKYLLLETLANHSFKNENIILHEENKWLGTFTFWDRKKIHCSSLNHSRMVIARHIHGFSSMVEEARKILDFFRRCLQRKPGEHR
jgi:hypothetical protein